MAVSYVDYYKTLGVPRTATEKEIKGAYRRLARKHHPDLNPGNKQAEARFKEINEAHEVLSDPEKRKRYDALGENWQSFAQGGWPPPGGRVRVNVGNPEDLGGFSDFFKTIFGGGFGGFGDGVEIPPEAMDREADVSLSLEEVLKGTTRTLDLGKGGRRVEVRIPAGVREGSRVRVAGEAGGKGAPAGDLYLRVHLQPHPVFRRSGDDLETTVPVPLSTAVLGGEVDVPTLEAKLGIKVPAGTSPGQVFRLRGHGLPRLERGGGRGDILASLAVKIPSSLSKRERELFEELRSLGK